jgi:hypothetical protein
MPFAKTRQQGISVFHSFPELHQDPLSRRPSFGEICRPPPAIRASGADIRAGWSRFISRPGLLNTPPRPHGWSFWIAAEHEDARHRPDIHPATAYVNKI